MSRKQRNPLRGVDFEDFKVDDEYEFDFELDDDDILEWCGERNARKGEALATQGAITTRSVADSTIRGIFVQGERRLPLLCDPADESAICTDPSHARSGAHWCEHIAALLYTFLDEPETFVDASTGEAVEISAQNPARAMDTGPGRRQLSAARQALEQVTAQTRSQIGAPPEATPEQAAARAKPPAPVEQLAALLQSLALDKLRAIARRRGWPANASAKDKLVETPASGLAREPMPPSLSPEEDQLLRIEGTLYGVSTTRTPQAIEATWKKHGGGNRERLGRALDGLQSAGLLFPCTQDGGALHYHWMPLLDSRAIPLLPTKVKPYPEHKTERLAKGDPLPPPSAVADAIVEMAEKSPLQARTIKVDPRVAQIVGNWPFVPAQLEQVVKNRQYSGLPPVLTVPFSHFWMAATSQEMATLVAVHAILAAWVSGALVALGVLVESGVGSVAVMPSAPPSGVACRSKSASGGCGNRGGWAERARSTRGRHGALVAYGGTFALRPEPDATCTHRRDDVPAPVHHALARRARPADVVQLEILRGTGPRSAAPTLRTRRRIRMRGILRRPKRITAIWRSTPSTGMPLIVRSWRPCWKASWAGRAPSSSGTTARNWSRCGSRRLASGCSPGARRATIPGAPRTRRPDAKR